MSAARSKTSQAARNRVALRRLVRRTTIVESKMGMGLVLAKFCPRDDGAWDKYCWIGLTWKYNDTVCDDTVLEWQKKSHYIAPNAELCQRDEPVNASKTQQR